MDVSWTIKKAESLRIDASELCWRRLLRVPWTARETKPVNPKGNQSWIFTGRTDAGAEAPIFGHLMWRTNSLEKTWMLAKIEGRRRDNRGRDGWMASLTQQTWVWASSRRWWRTRKPGMLQSMRSQRVRHDWATEQQQAVGIAAVSHPNRDPTLRECNGRDSLEIYKSTDI